jgi:hypothetical protein
VRRLCCHLLYLPPASAWGESKSRLSIWPVKLQVQIESRLIIAFSPLYARMGGHPPSPLSVNDLYDRRLFVFVEMLI